MTDNPTADRSADPKPYSLAWRWRLVLRAAADPIARRHLPLLITLADTVNGRTGVGWWSTGRLAEGAGLTRRNAITGLKALADAGFIGREECKGGRTLTARYWLVSGEKGDAHDTLSGADPVLAAHTQHARNAPTVTAERVMSATQKGDADITRTGFIEPASEKQTPFRERQEQTPSASRTEAAGGFANSEGETGDSLQARKGEADREARKSGRAGKSTRAKSRTASRKTGVVYATLGRVEPHPIPADWWPCEARIRWFEENYGFLDYDLAYYAEEFRDEALGNGWLRANWDAAFAGWLRGLEGTPEVAAEAHGVRPPQRKAKRSGGAA